MRAPGKGRILLNSASEGCSFSRTTPLAMMRFLCAGLATEASEEICSAGVQCDGAKLCTVIAAVFASSTRLTVVRNVPLSRELIQAKSNLICLSVRNQVVPGHLAALKAGHAGEHATERGLHSVGNLIVRGSFCDACQE